MNKKERDVNVELLRIIASFIVVGTHIKLMNYMGVDGNTIDNSIILISGFFGEGVTIWFLILGFFYFKNPSFKKLIKRTFFTIVIPCVIYLILVQLIYPWMTCSISLADCILNPQININNIFTNLFQLTTQGIDGAQHLWFVFSYVIAILYFPILKSVDCAKNSYFVKKYIIIFGLVAVVIIDIQKLFVLPFGISTISFVTIPVLLLLIGDWLYGSKNKFGYHSLIIGSMLYILLHIIQYKVACFIFQNGLSARFAWDSMFQIGSAVGITMAILSLKNIKCRSNVIIRFIGARTFGIYLIHYALTIVLSSRGYNTTFLNRIQSVVGIGFISEIIYTLVYALVVFGLSLIISSLIYIVKKIILKYFIFRSRKNEINNSNPVL